MSEPRPAPSRFPLPAPWAELLAGEHDFLSLTRHLRCLAVSLVDEATADDLVQEAWLAALDGERQGIQDPRAWLLRVVRNRAGGHLRSKLRRSDIEALWAPEELVESEEELIERRSSHLLLRRCVEELREPYRGVLLERFFEERSVADIAAGRGVSRDTVKSQVRRGIDELRRTLDRHHGGDREAWAAVLVPLAVRERVSPAVPLTSKVGTLHPWLVGAGVMAALVTVILIVTGTAGGRSGAGLSASDPRVAGAPRPAFELETPEAREASFPPRPNLTTSPEPSAPAHRVRIEARTDAGQPAAGAQVHLWGRGRELLGRYTTDDQGIFEIELDPERLVGPPVIPGPHGGIDVAVLPKEGAWSWLYHLPVPPEGARLEVVAPARGQSLSGIVLDVDGRPLPGARVALERGLRGANRTPAGVPFGERTREAKSDAEGRFRIEAVPLRPHVLTASAPGLRPQVRVVEGEAARLEVEFRLEEGLILAGQVLEEGGGPVVGALVRDATFRPAGRGLVPVEARTDEEGFFELHGLAPGRHLLFAHDPAAPERFDNGVVEVGADEPAYWEAVLEPTPGIHVRVEEADGTPVAAAGLTVIGEREDVNFGRALQTDARGEARLLHVPAGGVALAVQRSSADTEPLAWRRELRPGPDLVRIRLDPLEKAFATVSGRLRSHSGGPLAAGKLVGCGEGRSFQVALDPGTGSFRASAPPGDYRLWAVIEGSGCVRLPAITLEAGADLELSQRRALQPQWVALAWQSERPTAERPFLLWIDESCADLMPPVVRNLSEPIAGLELMPGRYRLGPAGGEGLTRFEVRANEPLTVGL